MKVDIEPGKYVVAVSGGVDSVALLDVLSRKPGLDLVVAHFDHGIRSESAKDRLLVQMLAQERSLSFIYDEGQLGPYASEAAARQARYAFLEQVRSDTHALAIITAHQQDDVLETAILNILRGTGRKGLSSLTSTPNIIRPLVGVPKRKIIDYARDHNLAWHEDSTNSDDRYLRNYIRLHLLPRFDAADKERLLAILDSTGLLNKQIDDQLSALLASQSEAPDIDRKWIVMLPHVVAKEVAAAWLRCNGIRDFDAKTLERITVAVKTLHPGSTIDVSGGASIKIGKDLLALIKPER